MEPYLSQESSDLSLTKQALQVIQKLEAKVSALESEKHQPIAIIGLGCRFPGKVETPEQFWQLLQTQTDAITAIPRDRWCSQEFHHKDPSLPGKIITHHGGFVPNLYDFDAKFFRIAPREATSLDPQQRLLLEVSWEALENAGLAADQLDGHRAGVFIGISAIDYWHQLLSQPPQQIDAYLATGNTHSMASGRLSHFLGFVGPSLSIDTACSSSLSAVHMACQSLRQRHCDMALAGGVNRILAPEISINFSQAKMLAPDGRCKSFDAAADGFGRSEGCGIIVLKRLSDALAAQDNIRAVIMGSAINHTGRTSGLTVPNGPAQQDVIREAIANSQIEPTQISYIEAHGTGTALGDPIEIGALGNVFGPLRTAADPLWVGSVKTNLGHAEAASGMAGLIKVILALQQQEIPANLHFHVPNPLIDWQQYPLRVPTDNLPWLQEHKRRIAGVSSFGFNGANAHLVVAEAPLPSRLDTAVSTHLDSDALAYLMTVSAQTRVALNQSTTKYITYLADHSSTSLADICFTANTGRSQFGYRLAIIATTVSDLQKKLVLFNQGISNRDVFSGQAQDYHRASVTVRHTKEQVPCTGTGQDLFLPLIAEQSEFDQHSRLETLRTLAKLYIQGTSIHWDPAIYQDNRKVELPTYPFQRQPYGIDSTDGTC